MLIKITKIKMHGQAVSFLAACAKFDWKIKQGGLLTHQEYLLCSALDVLIQETRARAKAFYLQKITQHVQQQTVLEM